MTLNKLLLLDEIEENCYRGHSLSFGAGRVFGGQFVAQALVAAGNTCAEQTAHSLHCYFLHAGDLDLPIDYRVEHIRDGRSLATRQVTAWQNGRRIFLMNASFLTDDKGLEYQSDMPDVIGPDELPELSKSCDSSAPHRPPREKMRVDIRPVPAEANASEVNHKKYWWFKLLDVFPDNLLLRQASLAYCSDFGFLWTAPEIHGLKFRQPGVFTASLDHSVWFHRDFSVDDWLLHAMECSSTGQSRGFVRGQFFNQVGTLIASVAQEGVIRTGS